MLTVGSLLLCCAGTAKRQIDVRLAKPPIYIYMLYPSFAVPNQAHYEDTEVELHAFIIAELDEDERPIYPRGKKL